MYDSLVSLLSLLLVTAAAYAVGRRLAAGLRLDGEDTVCRTAWSTTLGFVVLGMAVAALGFAGGLYRATIGIPTMVLAGLALSDWWQARRLKRTTAATSATLDDAAPVIAMVPRWIATGSMLLASMTLLVTLPAALAPPTAGDAMCYHLELPKEYLLGHTIEFSPLHENSTFPLLAEMWYLWALAIDGGVAAQLVHWMWGVLFAAGTLVLATPLVGRGWGRVAATLALVTPGVTNQMTAPLNDVASAALTTFALAAWYRAVVEDRGPRWFIVAGVMFGAAAATKYVALLFAVGLVAHGLWCLARNAARRQQLLSGGLALAIVATSVAGIWYVRAAWHRGNPVYPFFNTAFAGADLGALPERKTPLLSSLGDLATAPWQITMQPDRFGGRGHRLGPLALAMLPGLLVCRRLRGLGVLLGVAAAFAVGWLVLRQNVRFLFPVVPPICVACVWCVAEWRRLPRTPRVIAYAALVAVVCLHVAVAGWRTRGKLAVAVGGESRAEYLMRCEPTYRAAATANALYTPGDRIFSQDYRGFYFRAPVVRECTYRQVTEYDRHVHDGPSLCSHLTTAGFTHILLAESDDDGVHTGGIHYNDTLSRLWDTPGETGDADPRTVKPVQLANYNVTDSDGMRRSYRLVRLVRVGE